MNIPLNIYENEIIVSKPDIYKPINVKTLVYPGFVTDFYFRRNNLREPYGTC